MGAPRLTVAAVVAAIDLLALTASGWAQSPNWSGVYLGGEAGYYFGHNEWQVAGDNILDEPAMSGFPDFSGWVHGGHLGYLTQQGGLVFGGEVSIMGGTPKGSAICSFIGSFCENKFDYLATLSGRLGVPIGNFLPYMTVGVAELHMRVVRGVGFDVLTGTGTHYGMAFGVGIDYALNSTVSVGIDARRYLLGGRDYMLTGSILQENAWIKPDPEVIMMRLSFRFGESPYASKPTGHE